MRTAVLCLSLLLVATPSLAADPAAPGASLPPPTYAAPPAVFDWSGASLGGIAGFGLQDYGSADATLETEGVIGGVFAGYDVLVAPNVVAGAQADVVFGDFGASEDMFSVESDYLATFRARLGFAVDSVLLYGTGGLAVTDVRVEAGGESRSATTLGYAVGAGVETAVTDNISARFEYLYVDTPEETFDLGGASTSVDADSHQFRVGLGYRF